MTAIFNVFETEPIFVNELGVKWWLDTDMQQWADRDSIDLPKIDVKCFFVQEPSGYKTRVLVSGGKVVFDSQQMETMAVRIDMMRIALR